MEPLEHIPADIWNELLRYVEHPSYTVVVHGGGAWDKELRVVVRWNKLDFVLREYWNGFTHSFDRASLDAFWTALTRGETPPPLNVSNNWSVRVTPASLVLTNEERDYNCVHFTRLYWGVLRALLDDVLHTVTAPEGALGPPATTEGNNPQGWFGPRGTYNQEPPETTIDIAPLIQRIPYEVREALLESKVVRVKRKCGEENEEERRYLITSGRNMPGLETTIDWNEESRLSPPAVETRLRKLEDWLAVPAARNLYQPDHKCEFDFARLHPDSSQPAVMLMRNGEIFAEILIIAPFTTMEQILRALYAA